MSVGATSRRLLSRVDAFHGHSPTACRGEVRAGGVEPDGPAPGAHRLWKGADACARQRRGRVRLCCNFCQLRGSGSYARIWSNRLCWRWTKLAMVSPSKAPQSMRVSFSQRSKRSRGEIMFLIRAGHPVEIEEEPKSQSARRILRVKPRLTRAGEKLLVPDWISPEACVGGPMDSAAETHRRTSKTGKPLEPPVHSPAL